MNFEIRYADLSEAAALTALDEKIFSASDRFTEEIWGWFQSFWIVRDGAIVGLISLCHDMDVSAEEGMSTRLGSLYIANIGILPEFQGIGLGTFVTGWEIVYAKTQGFSRVVLNCRKSNRRMIRLGQKFGFEKINEIPSYYEDPDEPAVVMEFRLKSE